MAERTLDVRACKPKKSHLLNAEGQQPSLLKNIPMKIFFLCGKPFLIIARIRKNEQTQQ